MHHKRLTAQYEEFFSIAATAGVPMFNSPGNHEMDRVDKTEDGKDHETIETPDEKMQALYLEVMKYPANAPPYGAFNYGNSRFIAIDTEEIPTTLAVQSPGKVVAGKLKLDPGFVSPTQIELLTSDLEANKHKEHIFVFMHHPIKPAKSGSMLNAENATALETLFAKYRNVSYVIAAHEHIYYNASSKTHKPPPRTAKSGPIYLVSGGAGAPLDKCPTPQKKNCSASHHYLVFEVNGKKVDVKVVMVSATTKKKTG
jgi:Calcineurin-like phosphoesterase